MIALLENLLPARAIRGIRRVGLRLAHFGTSSVVHELMHCVETRQHAMAYELLQELLEITGYDDREYRNCEAYINLTWPSEPQVKRF